ncbi:potassium channel family protein [Herbidospora daliensis]|uniref:potassium channel family protein n=1 Tax=Herbidospora daliensis TaxID=295585 RepID=UPI0007C6B660|nr:potassium channel family protein [Herbidospora daliensis]
MRAEWRLLVFAGVFLVAYATPILFPQLPYDWKLTCWLAQLGCWLLFLAEYAVRFARAGDKKAFAKENLLDLLVILLPLMMPLRMLQRRLGFQRRVLTFTATTTLVLGLAASLAVLRVERDAPGATILTFGDATWWAVTTMTTTGYGDTYPVTPDGRLIGAALMLGGVALLGVVTATLASWFGRRFDTGDDTERLLREALKEIGELKEMLRTRG